MWKAERANRQENRVTAQERSRRRAACARWPDDGGRAVSGCLLAQRRGRVLRPLKSSASGPELRGPKAPASTPPALRCGRRSQRKTAVPDGPERHRPLADLRIASKLIPSHSKFVVRDRDDALPEMGSTVMPRRRPLERPSRQVNCRHAGTLLVSGYWTSDDISPISQETGGADLIVERINGKQPALARRDPSLAA